MTATATTLAMTPNDATTADLPSYRFTHSTVSPDGRFISCGSISDGTVRIWKDWNNGIVNAAGTENDNDYSHTTASTMTTTTNDSFRYYIVSLPAGGTYPTTSRNNNHHNNNDVVDGRYDEEGRYVFELVDEMKQMLPPAG